jgi:thiamine biosynthesis lipoprotein
MGSTVRVLAFGASESTMTNAAAEIERLESLWSRFRPTSEVARLNGAAGTGAVPVSIETIELVERAVDLWHETDHGFDPTVLRALETHGYDETFARVRARATALASAPAGREPVVLQIGRMQSPVAATASPGCGGIELDRGNRTVSLPHGVSIDLGGVGKGFTADHISGLLLEHGALSACVSMGGDVRCRGIGPDDGGWDIDVEDPRVEGISLLTAHLRSSAIVTSTTRWRRWHHRGRAKHHLIDPSTGEPSVNDVCAAIVADTSAWRAEGFAKAAIIGGLVDGMALLDGAGMAGLLVDHGGHAHQTVRPIETTAENIDTDERPK